MNRALVGWVLAGCLALSLWPGAASAQPVPYCRPGQQPVFLYGFRTLAEQLGEVMGEPLECEHRSRLEGDTIQQTSRGVAFYQQASNTPTFNDGYRHWALTLDGLVFWTGESIMPPDSEAIQWPASEVCAALPADSSGPLIVACLGQYLDSYLPGGRSQRGEPPRQWVPQPAAASTEAVSLEQAEWVGVYDLPLGADELTVIRAGGEFWLLNYGITCLRLGRYQGRAVLVASPGPFAGDGATIILPEEGRVCRIWDSRRLR